jgi:hypothetical protein
MGDLKNVCRYMRELNRSDKYDLSVQAFAEFMERSGFVITPELARFYNSATRDAERPDSLKWMSSKETDSYNLKKEILLQYRFA